ncbi:MAG TPA: molybdopterin-dependent oxidoreductase, partial [Candidatus Limnocylindrales bacterium]
MQAPHGPRVPRPWAAALSGALAAGVAAATSELVAAAVPASTSAVVSVGAVAIALQPPGAKDLVVALFGLNDKAALNTLVLIVTLVLAAVAGLVAARRPRAGAGIFVAFGVLAALAGAVQPNAPVLAQVANAALSTAAALVALRALLARAPAIRPDRPVLPDHPDRPVRPDRPDAGPADRLAGRSDEPWTRRRFLIASAGTLGGAVVAGAIGRSVTDSEHFEGVVTSTKLPLALHPVSPLDAGQSLSVPGITPLVVPADAFYRIDTALLVPQVEVDHWQLRVTGMVERPLTFTYDQLLAMPLYEQYVTIACVSNRVGGHLVGNALWTGVRLKDVLAEAGVKPGATQIVGRSYDDFSVGFPTAWAMAPDREPMIAVGMDRAPLPAAHGFPARLIVPGLYGYVSATKWLTEIELTTREAVDGYWVPLGWAKDGPILTQSRIDVPSDG